MTKSRVKVLLGSVVLLLVVRAVACSLPWSPWAHTTGPLSDPSSSEAEIEGMLDDEYLGQWVYEKGGLPGARNGDSLFLLERRGAEAVIETAPQDKWDVAVGDAVAKEDGVAFRLAYARYSRNFSSSLSVHFEVEPDTTKAVFCAQPDSLTPLEAADLCFWARRVEATGGANGAARVHGALARFASRSQSRQVQER